MSALSVVRVSRSTKPVPPQLAQEVDHLHELRALIRQSQEAERQMTAEILQAMQEAGLMQLSGAQAVAFAGERVSLKPDPQLFLETVGPRAYEALTVSTTAARHLMGADDLAAISESTMIPVLRLEPRKAVA
jgi:hypothetical protein